MKAEHPSTLLYLKGIQRLELGNIVDFIYNGEIYLPQKDLAAFLETAQDLQIKGIPKKKMKQEMFNIIQKKNTINI